MNKEYTINTNSLIAICHVSDKIIEFVQDLKEEGTILSDRSIVFKLDSILKSETFIGTRSTKKFLEDNKNIIDEITKHISLSEFIIKNYGLNGEIYNYGSLMYYFEEIIPQKEKIDIVIKNLEKIKKLDIEQFKINNNYNFRDDYYDLSTNYDKNNFVVYLSDIQIISSSTDNIRYTSESSNYKILCNIFNGEISNSLKILYINNLFSDLVNFPKNIDYKEFFNELMNKMETNNNLSQIEEIELAIQGFEVQYDYISKIANELTDINTKEYLKEYLEDLKINISNIKRVCEESNYKKDKVLIK